MNPVWNDSMPTTDSKPTIFPNLRDLQTIGLPVHMVYEKLAFGSQWKKKMLKKSLYLSQQPQFWQKHPIISTRMFVIILIVAISDLQIYLNVWLSS